MLVYWKGNVVILTKFSSLAAPEAVILITSGATSDENFVKMTIFPLQWYKMGPRCWTPTYLFEMEPQSSPPMNWPAMKMGLTKSVIQASSHTRPHCNGKNHCQTQAHRKKWPLFCRRHAFSWAQMFEFRFQFQWSLFPRVPLTIGQHWLR